MGYNLTEKIDCYSIGLLTCLPTPLPTMLSYDRISLLSLSEERNDNSVK